MKAKSTLLVLAIIGIIATISSCRNDDDNKPSQEQTFKKKIIGKWKSGDNLLTDYKCLLTYNVDSTVVYTCLDKDLWLHATAGTYSLSNNRVSMTIEGETTESTIESVTDDELTFSSWTMSGYTVDKVIMKKVTQDFSKTIIGTWEGVEFTGMDTFGNEQHCWKFNTDGTYVYYSRNTEGNWIPDAGNSGNRYYVEGDLYCSRFLLNGVEHVEKWDIQYCNDAEMYWTALRKTENDSSITTTMKMKRVE